MPASAPFAQCPSALCCVGIVAVGDITNTAASDWRAGKESVRGEHLHGPGTQGEYVGVRLITESCCREQGTEVFFIPISP